MEEYSLLDARVKTLENLIGLKAPDFCIKNEVNIIRYQLEGFMI